MAAHCQKAGSELRETALDLGAIDASDVVGGNERH
jgi:hypothetical protein